MVTINSWKALVDLEFDLESRKGEWVFRGHSSPTHRLKTTLERAFEDFGVERDMMQTIERALIADFKRSCHLYSASILPDDSDSISWLALMRHYGAPTRLLDFTYSFFIAAYFAAEAEKAEPVVWAVNKSWLASHMKEVFHSLPDGARFWEAWGRREGWAFDQLFIKREPSLDVMVAINPLMMNERLAVQQGVFLSFSDVTVPLHQALEAIPGSADNLVMFLIDPNARHEILSRLYRTGVNRAALFPGLQGYAESLRPKIILLMKLHQLTAQGFRMDPNINITGV